MIVSETKSCRFVGLMILSIIFNATIKVNVYVLFTVEYKVQSTQCCPIFIDGQLVENIPQLGLVSHLGNIMYENKKTVGLFLLNVINRVQVKKYDMLTICCAFYFCYKKQTAANFLF